MNAARQENGVAEGERARLRVLHVAPSFWPALSYGGPTESTYQLCRHLAQAGCEVTVLTTDSDGLGRRSVVDTTAEVAFEERMRVRYCRKLMRHSVSPVLLSNISKYVADAHVVHLTGVYNFTTFPTLAACRRFGKPLVWSPRGSLQLWPGRRRTTAKHLWDRMCGKIAPKQIVGHVTSRAEADSIKSRWPWMPISLISNGVAIPEKPPARRPRGESLRLLYIGRLDPKKGIENLLEACALLARDGFVEWLLTVAGGGSRYAVALRDRIAECGLTQKVTMAGPVHGEQKEVAFAEADVVVMPSYVENFGIAAAEALARERPVIASRGTPWREVEEIGCGLWVENDPRSLADAIRRIAAMPLDEMGRRGRRWMMDKFAWPLIADQMRECYQATIRKSQTQPSP
ncbi:MAG: glycosyltransferase [Candidatus Binataceae bacterium]|nr:glycosyltransferase [Candidatus Binataceae bacterium]